MSRHRRQQCKRARARAGCVFVYSAHLGRMVWVGAHDFWTKPSRLWKVRP